MDKSYISTFLTGFLAVTLPFAAGFGCCEGNETDDAAVGRQLVSKWSQSIKPISRLSVRYTKQEFNRVFETMKVSRGFCAFDGADRWLVREVPPTNEELARIEKVSPHPVSNGREFRQDEGRPLFLLVTATSTAMNADEQFSQFVQYTTSPPSALMPENECFSGFWNGLQRFFRQAREPTVIVPIFLPMTSRLDLYEIRSVDQTTLGTRVRFHPKNDDPYTTAVGRIDAYFQTDSKLPHVVRYVNEHFETRFLFESVRMKDTAEMDEATFQLPLGTQCTSDIEDESEG